MKKTFDVLCKLNIEEVSSLHKFCKGTEVEKVVMQPCNSIEWSYFNECGFFVSIQPQKGNKKVIMLEWQEVRDIMLPETLYSITRTMDDLLFNKLVIYYGR